MCKMFEKMGNFHIYFCFKISKLLFSDFPSKTMYKKLILAFMKHKMSFKAADDEQDSKCSIRKYCKPI